MKWLIIDTYVHNKIMSTDKCQVMSTIYIDSRIGNNSKRLPRCMQGYSGNVAPRTVILIKIMTQTVDKSWAIEEVQSSQQ